jgi:hypothetical protein
MKSDFNSFLILAHAKAQRRQEHFFNKIFILCELSDFARELKLRSL